MEKARKRAEPQPATVGAIYALVAAAFFGASAPGAKLLLADTNPVILVALLYLGAALMLMALKLGSWRREPTRREARLRGIDFPILTLVILFGGVAGPILMLYGLTRVTALAGSLLLNLEAPLTMFIAVTMFGEHVGRRSLAGAAAIVAGAAILGWAPGGFRADTIGAAAIAIACLCWAIDNNLTQRLTVRDPATIAHVKALAAAVTAAIIAMLTGVRLPKPWTVGGALVLGALSYGVSLYFAMYAMRILGAARQSAYFATAPFIGALISIPIFGMLPGAHEWTAASLMAIGAAMLLGDRHNHAHAHDGFAHDHLHFHDIHHRHDHSPEISATEPHTHPHRHVRLVHSHPHASDIHHRHSHRDSTRRSR